MAIRVELSEAAAMHLLMQTVGAWVGVAVRVAVEVLGDSRHCATWDVLATLDG